MGSNRLILNKFLLSRTDLNGESSEIIYKALVETGSSIMHLDDRKLACEIKDMEPESVVYLCSIN